MPYNHDTHTGVIIRIITIITLIMIGVKFLSLILIFIRRKKVSWNPSPPLMDNIIFGVKNYTVEHNWHPGRTDQFVPIMETCQLRKICLTQKVQAGTEHFVSFMETCQLWECQLWRFHCINLIVMHQCRLTVPDTKKGRFLSSPLWALFHYPQKISVHLWPTVQLRSRDTLSEQTWNT